MFSSKATTLAVSASLVAVASALTINTPSALIQCQPSLLSWGDGVAPYYLAVIPGGQPSAAALENLPQQTGTSYTWLVDLAAGQSVTIRVTDATGAINYSDKVTIQPGTVTSCAAGPSSAASSSAGGNVVVASSTGRQPLTSTSAAPVTFTSSMATLLISPTTASATTKPVSSGINNNAAASSSPAATSSKPNSAATLKAASGLLVGALIFALAA